MIESWRVHLDLLFLLSLFWFWTVPQWGLVSVSHFRVFDDDDVS